jgi:hypothetical protein
LSITLETLRHYQPEAIERFGGSDSIAYAQISQTQFSIARYSGGCVVNGKHFIYCPTDDSLIRDDVFKWLVNRLKEDGKKKHEPRTSEATLFDAACDGPEHTDTTGVCHD